MFENLAFFCFVNSLFSQYFSCMWPSAVGVTIMPPRGGTITAQSRPSAPARTWFALVYRVGLFACLSLLCCPPSPANQPAHPEHLWCPSPALGPGQ